MMVHHENHQRDGGGGGGRPNVAVERIPQQQQQQQQPFDSYPSGMAVTLGLGYPFTPAQWKELERQAMIYKCMVANVPVPSELLLPLTTDPRLSLSSGYSLKFGRDGDPEPGRCKRTDGKKWRCSRDAAPDQKYCERHLNRGRPRSRKPVEVSGSTSNKKSCHRHLPNPSPSAASVATNPSTNYAHGGGVAARSHAPVFLQGSNPGAFQHPTSLFPHKDSRGLDWLMIGEPQPQLSEETLNLNTSSYDNGRGNQFNECLFSLNTMEKQPHHHNTETTRGFIDAWSDNSKHAPSSATAVHEKLSLSMDDEMGRIHMGLGVTNWDYDSTTKCQPSWVGSGSWISSTPPGGPLGEVLHHRTSTPSSPSRVIPNKLGSLSDSSGEGSVEPEITLQWFS